MSNIKYISIFAFAIFAFSFNSKSKFLSETSYSGKDTTFYNTKDWASSKADYEKSNIKAMLNDNYWTGKGSGYHRKGSGDSKIEFGTKGPQLGPKISIGFKKFTGKGKYKLGACFDLDCSSCMVKIVGANLAADDKKSFLEVTKFDTISGLVSGNFTLYFDPNTPKVNTKSAFKKILFFEKGTFQDVKLDIYE